VTTKIKSAAIGDVTVPSGDVLEAPEGQRFLVCATCGNNDFFVRVRIMDIHAAATALVCRHCLAELGLVSEIMQATPIS
jgi:hypothetical protein